LNAEKIKIQIGRKRESEKKNVNDKDEIIQVLQPDRSPQILTRKNKKREKEINYVSRLSPFKRGIGVGCKNESK
jgi:hypothetical protein